MKYKSAITKAELLVVLGCLILAFFNLGGLNSAGRKRARRIVCAATIARFSQANHIYADNWDEQFCPPMMQDESMPEGEQIKNWLTNYDFRKYIGLGEGEISTWGIAMPKEYQCPSNILLEQVSSIYNRTFSYGYNVADWDSGRLGSDYGLTCYWMDETNPTCNPQPWQIGYRRTTIPNPSKKINFSESNDWWTTWERGANYLQGWDILGQAPPYDDELSSYANIGMWGATLYRHNEGANFAFYDGHVEYLTKEQAFIDTDGNPALPNTDDATRMWYLLPP